MSRRLLFVFQVFALDWARVAIYRHHPWLGRTGFGSLGQHRCLSMEWWENFTGCTSCCGWRKCGDSDTEAVPTTIFTQNDHVHRTTPERFSLFTIVECNSWCWNCWDPTGYESIRQQMQWKRLLAIQIQCLRERLGLGNEDCQDLIATMATRYNKDFLQDWAFGRSAILHFSQIIESATSNDDVWEFFKSGLLVNSKGDMWISCLRGWWGWETWHFCDWCSGCSKISMDGSGIHTFGLVHLHFPKMW